MKNYTELMSLQSFEDRYNYLRLNGSVGKSTFGYDRWLNQSFYHWDEWKRVRRDVIARDGGCDLGCPDRQIPNGARLMIHHIIPITAEDIKNRSKLVLDPENLITVMDSTHNAIHYGDESLLMSTKPAERQPNDTCPWR